MSSSLLQNRWTDPTAFIEKSSWMDLCTPTVVADLVATREELEHAIRMAFAESLDPFTPNATSQTKTNYAQQLKFSRAFVASLSLSENIPRIAPLVFEGMESAIEDASNVEARMMQMTRKKNSSLLNSRQQWVGAARFPIATLSMIAWLRISKTIVVEEEEAAQQQYQRTLLGISSSSSTLGTTSNGNSLANKWPPISVAGAKRFLARVLPLSFIPTFVFASTSSTIPGLLATITTMANEAGSGFLSTVDPMSRCALICVAASGDGVETAIVSELTTADVQGEKGFFRTPVSYPCSSETQPAQQNDVFSIANWFNTSDAAAPYSVSQMHHPFLVYALRRSLSRMEISSPAAAKWLQYCEVVVKDVEGFASKILGRSTTRSIHWLSSGTKGIGIRFWDALLRECALMCESAAVHMTKPESQLSTLLWMLVSHASQGVRASLSLREYDPLLEIRDTDGSSAANAIILAPPTSNNNRANASSGPTKPFVCSPEQLFVLCRAALRCDISLSKQDKRSRATNFMADVCTEEVLVSLSLDPSQVACTIVAILRFACEFNVPLEPHLHLVFSVVALSPLIGATILADHLKFIYKSLSSVGRVELLLRILFLPISCAALEVQMALSDNPPEDFEDASFCLFHLWRCIAPINATSRAQTMSLYTIFRACFALAFNNDSDFKLMWECCMLDDLCLMGERERAASVCVKDSLLDGFFECVAENNMNRGTRNVAGGSSQQHENAWIEEEGILHATTFMFRFGVFPRMHCAEILKRIVLHVRVLLGTSSTSTNNNNINGNNNKTRFNETTNGDDGQQITNGQVLSLLSDGNNNNGDPNSSSSSSASTLLQFLCGFGSSNAGVLHDDFDRYSDAFFDAIANVLVIAGKYAASQGERSASRVFHSLHELAWECLTSFKTSTISASTPSTSPTTANYYATTNHSASILSAQSNSSSKLQQQQRQLQAQANKLSVNQMLLGHHTTFSSLVDVPRRGLPPTAATMSPSIHSAISLMSSSIGNQISNGNATSPSLQVFSNNNNAASSISSSSNDVTPNATTRLSSPPGSGGRIQTPTTTTGAAANNNNNNETNQSTTKSALRSFFGGGSSNANVLSQSSAHLTFLGGSNNSGGGTAVTTSTAFLLTTNTQNISDKTTKVPACDQHGDTDFLLYCQDDSINVMSLQPTVNFVALRVVGLKSLPSIQERMLKRLEAIAISLAHVTARHVSLRERAVMWLRACWKAAENWLNSYHSRNGGSGNSNFNNNMMMTAKCPNSANGLSLLLMASASQQKQQQQQSSLSGGQDNTQTQIQNLFAAINNEDNNNTDQKKKKALKSRTTKNDGKKVKSNEATSIELFSPTMMAMLLGNNNNVSNNNDDGSNNRKNPAAELIRERCEQLCITCSSLCNLLLHHTDVLIAAGGGSAAGSM